VKTQPDADQDRSPEARFSFRALRRWLSLSPEEGTAASVRAPRTFRALRHRNFRLFWWGQLVSLSGTWMQITAQGWLIYRLTGSPLYLGLMGFARYFPVLLFTLLGGVAADRFPKRTLLILTQFAAMLQALLMAVLTFTGAIEVWHILALSALLGVVQAFDTPARQAFLVEMVGKEDLMNSIALNSSVFNAARIVGPAIAGALVRAMGEAGAFTVNAVSFTAVLISLVRMNTAELLPASSEASASTIWTRVREGVRYARREIVIQTVLVLIAVASVFGISYVALMPAFARDVLGVGSEGYGALMAAAGVGALVGALFLATWGGRFRKGRLFTVGNLLFPVSLAAFALSRSFWLSEALLVLVGFGVVLQNATANTILQTRAREGFRGRVMSLYALVFIGMFPFGDLQAGVIADLVSPPFAVGLGALISLSAALWALLKRPQLRGLS
jgi:MFS family permease